MGDIVYIVDPEPAERDSLLHALVGEPITIEVYDCAEGFLAQTNTMPSGCVLAPVDLPGIGVRGLIREIRRRDLALVVVVIGRDSDFTAVVDLVRLGASDFLEHPFSERRLRSAVRRAIGSST